MEFQSLNDEIRKFVKVRDWEKFHSPKNLSMALFVETAEVAELFMWVSGEQSFATAKQKKEALEKELADVFIYLLLLAEKVNCNLVEAATRKLCENETRYPVNRSKGNARKYLEL
jgi:NTP pyrophosphatase (non-canonical NTP hydrolase)